MNSKYVAVVLAGVLAALVCAASDVGAQCVVDTSTPTYDNGKFLRYTPCNENGALKTTGAGGGGGGDASAANQTTIIGHVDGVEGILTTIDADTGTIAGAVDGIKIRAMLVDSSGNEIVIPTAGLFHNIVSAASTNATNVVAGGATVYHISLRNTTTTAYSVRLYNTVGTPTCSSATGYVTTIIVPPASAAGQVGGSETPLNIGGAFPTGLAYCITGGPTSTDNTNAAVGVYGFIMYKVN